MYTMSGSCTTSARVPALLPQRRTARGARCPTFKPQPSRPWHQVGSSAQQPHPPSRAPQAASGAASGTFGSDPSKVSTSDITDRLARYTQIAGSAAILFGVDAMLRYAFEALAIDFSPTLGGMLMSVALLVSGKAIGGLPERMVDSYVRFFTPLLAWIVRWMPVFFVPSLIVLPQALASVSGAEVMKIFQVTLGGWAASVLAASLLVRGIRSLVHSELTPDEEEETSPKPATPFTAGHYHFWIPANFVPLALSFVLPEYRTALGVAFLVASTIVGYLLGVAQPPPVKSVIHPLIFCGLYGNIACYLWGWVTGTSYMDTLAFYVQQGADAGLGPGNMLMKMLAVVVLTDAIRVYNQRKLVQRHAAEIIGTALASSMFSMFVTAALAAAVGMAPSLARSLLPRSVTVALALPMSETLGGVASLTAAIVCFTGLMGAALGQMVLNKLRVRDEISRGVAQASSSHGLGTAALAGQEPQALPFAAVTVAVMGATSNLLLCIPMVKGALLAITG